MVYIVFSERLASRLVSAGAVAAVTDVRGLDTILRGVDEECLILANKEVLGYCIRALSIKPSAKILLPPGIIVRSRAVMVRFCRMDIPGIGQVPVQVVTLAPKNEIDEDPWLSVARG